MGTPLCPLLPPLPLSLAQPLPGLAWTAHQLGTEMGSEHPPRAACDPPGLPVPPAGAGGSWRVPKSQAESGTSRSPSCAPGWQQPQPCPCLLPVPAGAAQPESLSHAQAGVDPGEAQLGTRSDTGQCRASSRQDLAVGAPGHSPGRRLWAQVSSGGGCAGQAAPWEGHLVAWGKGVFLLCLQSASLSQGSSAPATCL